MTGLERDTALALSNCTFLPASHDKRFARDIAHLATAGLDLSERQSAHLFRLAGKYRRQMPAGLVPVERPI
jgi:hypothetical protein